MIYFPSRHNKLVERVKGFRKFRPLTIMVYFEALIIRRRKQRKQKTEMNQILGDSKINSKTFLEFQVKFIIIYCLTGCCSFESFCSHKTG